MHGRWQPGSGHDESILKALPNPKIESLVVDLMLERWAKHRSYKEPQVAKAFRDSWYHSGFRLMRLALSSFGGLANDNNGLESFNNVQKEDQNFERYGITQFGPKFRLPNPNLAQTHLGTPPRSVPTVEPSHAHFQP